MGADLQSEHERYLVEKHFSLQSFYLIILKKSKHLHEIKRRWKNSSAMDVFSQELEKSLVVHKERKRLDVLKTKMQEMHVDEHELGGI